MNKTLGISAVVLAVTSSVAQASTVYSTIDTFTNPPPGYSLNLGSGQEITAYAVANEFNLAADASISSIEFYVAPLSPDLSNWQPQTINYYFFNQTGAGTSANPYRPASTVLVSDTVSSPNISVSDTGLVWASALGNTGHVWKVDFTLPTTFDASANTSYWLALNLTGNYGVQKDIYWVNSTMPGNSFYSTGPVILDPTLLFSWPSGNANLPTGTTTVAFKLNDSTAVPIPGALILFLSGIGALTGLARRSAGKI